MSENRILRKIGGKLRDETRDIVEARLPDRLRVLLARMTQIDDAGRHDSRHAEH